MYFYILRFSIINAQCLCQWEKVAQTFKVTWMLLQSARTNLPRVLENFLGTKNMTVAKQSPYIGKVLGQFTLGTFQRGLQPTVELPPCHSNINHTFLLA